MRARLHALCAALRPLPSPPVTNTDHGDTDTPSLLGGEGQASTQSREAIPWRLLIGIFLMCLCVYGTSPVVSRGDAFLAAPTTASIVHDFDLDISEYVGSGTDGGAAWIKGADDERKVDGVDIPTSPESEVYDYFPWTTAALAVPLYVVLLIPGKLAGIEFFDPQRMAGEGDAGLFNLLGGSLLTSSMIAVVAAIVWRAIPGEHTVSRRRRAVLTSVAVVALGTPAWSVLSRGLWNQSAATLAISLALYSAMRIEQAAPGTPTRRWTLALGVASGVAYATRPTGAVIVLVFAIWCAARHRQLFPWYVLGGAAVAMPWMSVNLATFGTVQPPYYSADRADFESYFWEALAGNLISPSRGLLVFSPVVIVAFVGVLLSRRTGGPSPLEYTALAAVTLHWLVVSGSGELWWAGATYGPRFFADMIPFFAYLAVPLIDCLLKGSHRKAGIAVAVLAVASVLVHVPGAWSKPAHCWNLQPNPVDEEPSRVWDPADWQPAEPLRVIADGGTLKDAALGRCGDL